MLGVGMKVRFVPSFANSEKFTPAERRAAEITGVITSINWEHEHFCVEYGNPKQRETFLFRDIGKVVSVIG